MEKHVWNASPLHPLNALEPLMFYRSDNFGIPKHTDVLGMLH